MPLRHPRTTSFSMSVSIAGTMAASHSVPITNAVPEPAILIWNRCIMYHQGVALKPAISHLEQMPTVNAALRPTISRLEQMYLLQDSHKAHDFSSGTDVYHQGSPKVSKFTSGTDVSTSRAILNQHFASGIHRCMHKHSPSQRSFIWHTQTSTPTESRAGDLSSGIHKCIHHQQSSKPASSIWRAQICASIEFRACDFDQHI